MVSGGTAVRLPRVVVAAASSGAGKTTVATGLIAALAGRGLKVSAHKVGPDYIDPGWHSVATGRPGRCLDPIMQGQERVVPLLLHGAATPEPADVAVIEGVMGLFDGAIGRDGAGSTAHVARLTDSPVLLVVDASRASRSVAAVVHGFATFEPGLRIGGVILNRIGTPRHEGEVRRAMDAVGIPVVGALRTHSALGVQSRHLGLVTAAEHDRAAAVTAVMAEQVGAGIDLDAVLQIAAQAPDLDADPWDPASQVTHRDRREQTADPGSQRPVVAVVSGRAFTFEYAEHRELLGAAGAQVLPVDPVSDAQLPSGTRALVIGGGFPEVHAEALSANGALREQIRDAVAAGMPVWAECAGLTYLAGTLDDHPMCGALDARARMTSRLTLGYREAVAMTDSVFLSAGERLTGHEFHRTVVEPRCAPADAGGAGAGPAWGWAVDGDTSAGPEGFAGGALVASYLHTHWAGAPQIPSRLVGAL